MPPTSSESRGKPFFPHGHDAVLDSRRLCLFAVSAREESFAAAAQTLNLSPSAISHSVKALEQDLGCILFRRSGPRVDLTEAGRRLLPLAEQLLRQMGRLREEVTGMAAAARQLRVGVPAVVCSGLLPVVLPDFQDSFPSMQLQILTEVEAMKAGASGELDLLLAPPGAIPAEGMRRELYRESLGCYVAPFHLLRKLDLVRLEDLKRHLVLVTDGDAGQRIGGSDSADGSGYGHRIWLLPGLHGVRELARVGQGVAVLPGWAQCRAPEGLVDLKVEGFPFERSCVAWWPREKPLSWAAEVFLSLVETAAAEHEDAARHQATAAVGPPGAE